MKLVFLFFIQFFLPAIVFGQSLKKDTSYYNGCGWIKERTYADSTIIFNSCTGEYNVFNKQGITIIEGRMGFNCGCEFLKNGIWIERYSLGELLSIGSYDCGQKSGEWIYFYENGNKKKIENYTKFYADSTSIAMPSTFLNGNYFEFYNNGNIKVLGSYEIKLAIDCVDVIIPEPPYLTMKQVSGIPKNFMSGTWYYYEKNGALKRKENHEN